MPTQTDFTSRSQQQIKIDLNDDLAFKDRTNTYKVPSEIEVKVAGEPISVVKSILTKLVEYQQY